MELFRALGSLIEAPGGASERAAELLDLGPLPDASVHTDLFLFELYPYASVYLGGEGRLGGEARDRMAGFWRALGIEPPEEPDQLSFLLAAYARLAELESAAAGVERQRWHHARRAFLWDHLLSWLPLYLDKLRDLDPPFYWGWADLLARALVEEAAVLPAPPAPPIHLRQAPALGDPRSDSAEAFLLGLLAPVRSGFVLARSDLGRAGQQLGLAARAGDRRIALRGLLAQDDKAALEWLAGEAARWAERHRAWQPATGAISSFWAARAASTSALLSELAAGL